MFPSDEVLQALKNTNVPILHLGGDHDLSVPVENWYALGGQLPTLNLIPTPARAMHRTTSVRRWRLRRSLPS